MSDKKTPGRSKRKLAITLDVELNSSAPPEITGGADVCDDDEGEFAEVTRTDVEEEPVEELDLVAMLEEMLENDGIGTERLPEGPEVPVVPEVPRVPEVPVVPEIPGIAQECALVPLPDLDTQNVLRARPGKGFKWGPHHIVWKSGGWEGTCPFHRGTKTAPKCKHWLPVGPDKDSNRELLRVKAWLVAGCFPTITTKEKHLAYVVGDEDISIPFLLEYQSKEQDANVCAHVIHCISLLGSAGGEGHGWARQGLGHKGEEHA